MMRERGREWPAPTLSDGTLRFAAIAAAFFQLDMPGIITIEEIENGIHASRLRLLVELMRSQTAAGKTSGHGHDPFACCAGLAQARGIRHDVLLQAR